MKVLFAGDFVPRERVAELISLKRYDDIFPGNLRKKIQSSDFSFVNLECPIADKNFKPISKYGPNLFCKNDVVDSLKYLGFTGVTLANNHILDYGKEGLNTTVECCKKEKLDVVGVGENIQQANRVLYLHKKGETLAIINCCEHEFSIATQNEAGANPLNPVRQFYSIQEARSKADYIVIVVHGGHEHFHLPSPRMKETYRYFIDAGVDAVINHHQHCYSGYEVYKEKPIFYGLGNFCFDREIQRNTSWSEGYLVELELEKGKSKFNIIPYLQGCDKPGILLLEDEESQNKFFSNVSSLNNIIADDVKLSLLHKEWMSKYSKHFILALEPYVGGFLTMLYMRNLLPSFITKKRSLQLLNYLQCESHLDRIRCVINDKLK